MTILITGGSKGIGRAIATRFAADGSHALIDSPNDDASAERTADLVRWCGRHCDPHRGRHRDA